MPWSETLPQFSLAGTVLTVLLLLFAAVGEPLLGRRAFAWLSRRRDGDGRALVLLHAVTMAVHVLWGLMVFGVLLLSPDLALADLGLRLPHAWGPILGGAIGGLLALALLWVLANGLPQPRSRGKGRGNRGHRPEQAGPPISEESGEQPGEEGRQNSGRRGRRAAVRPMTLPEPERNRGLLVPRTTAERALAAGVAVTGGVFGELLYRGLFIVLVASMGVPLWIAAALSVVLFSVAHIYQGWWGLLSAGASGTLFTVLYLGTGSIWVPVLVHVVLDLRSLAFPPVSVREEGDRGRYEGEYGHEYEDEGEYEEEGEYEAGYEYEEEGEYGGYAATPDHGPPAFADAPLAPSVPTGADGADGARHGTPSQGGVSEPSWGGPRHGAHSAGMPYGDPAPRQPDPVPDPDPYGAPGDILGSDYGQEHRPGGKRRLYPDEWIDRRYDDGNYTPGSGSAPGA